MKKEILHRHQGASAIGLAQMRISECAKVIKDSKRSVFVIHKGSQEVYCRVVPRGETARRKWCQKMGLET